MTVKDINNSTGVSLFAIFDGHVGAYVADYAKDVIVPKIMKKIIEARKIVQNGVILDMMKMKEKCFRVKRNIAEESPQTFDADCYVNGKDIDYGKMLEDEVIAADNELSLDLWRNNNRAGSTALIAVLEGSKLVVANVGDSRGVMCDEEGKTIPLSFDHKPNDPKEHQRVKEAGGFIAHYGVWRVNGMLAMSRALGDVIFKPNVVIANPDVLTFNLNSHK